MGIRSERGSSLQAPQSAISSIAHTVATATLSGFAAGVIAGGVGSRLAMRIVAITAGSADQGAITEAEATVGEITFGGTLFLLLAGGFAGAMGGLIYLAVRRWLAGAGRWKGLVFGLLLLAIFGAGIIEGDNPDFHRFGSSMLNVVMFAFLFVLFGLLVAPLFERVERTLPPPSAERSGPGARATEAFGVFLVLPGLLSMPIVTQGAALLLLPYVLIVVPMVSTLIVRVAGRFERLSDLRQHGGAMAAALVVLALPVVGGLALDVQAVVDIFEAA